jgi:hypothetical protein
MKEEKFLKIINDMINYNYSMGKTLKSDDHIEVANWLDENLLDHIYEPITFDLNVELEDEFIE